ncbi:MAG: isoprenyl transferase [Crocinitomicaceae bacterium]|nr:isoprenyl transferase [Crocinitomicaceae bacterium]MDG1657458.1 isoprenyl transferase [Crocinitomicaceae bacterium]
MSLLEKINRDTTPKHIAIIMDGNGRWAQQQGEERLFGHNFGVEAVRETLKAAQDMNVEHLTLYAFSTENWGRPKEEVDGLMDLLIKTIGNEVEELHNSNVVITTIGNTSGLPESCQKELRDAYETTKNNSGINLILALNYSAKWELTNATREIARLVAAKEIGLDDVNDDLISDHLSTKGIPDPELLIRTSGENRVSNFLLWQIAYSEFHFTEILWPDFGREDLYKAVLDYQSRERRFGMVSAQIEKS